MDWSALESSIISGCLKILAMVIVGLTPLVVSLLIKVGQERLSAATMNKENLRKNLLDRLDAFVLIQAGNIAERELPRIANQIKQGQLATSAQVRNELGQLGAGLKTQAIQYFNTQDIDIVSQVGEQKIEQLIEAAANKVSPFPGMKSSNVMLIQPVTDAIITQGTEYVKQHVFTLAAGKMTPVAVAAIANRTA